MKTQENKVINKFRYWELIVLIYLVSLVLSPAAESKPTNSFFSVGAGLNGNLYNAKFKELPGVQNCCVEFGNTFGLGYIFHFGYEYAFKKKVLDMPVRLDLSVSYSNLSANFSEMDNFANIITGNSYVVGKVEHRLESSLNTIFLEPGIFFKPIENLPLSFRLGLELGIIVTKKFTQSENLISPDGVTFENHLRTRNVQSGTLPESRSTMAALSFGARYDLFKSGNWNFMPEARFNYGLTSLVKDITWSVNNFSIGISAVYNFAEPEAEPPVKPPMPDYMPPEEPPVPSRVDVTVTYSDEGGKEIKDTELTVPVKWDVVKEQYYIIPILFYAKDDASTLNVIPNETSGSKLQEIKAYQHLIDALTDYIKKNPDTKVEIYSSSLDDESDAIVGKRINNAVGLLTSSGIDITRITVSKDIFERKKFKSEELADENRFITFRFSNGSQLLKNVYEVNKTATLVNKGKYINVKTDAVGDAKPIWVNSELRKNGYKIQDIGATKYSYQLDESSIDALHLRETTLEVNAKAIDHNENSGGMVKKLILKPKLTETIESINLVSDSEEDSTKYQQFILCYFPYNQYEPSIINQEVLTLTKDAINNNKRVALLPLTDYFGTEQYNRRLAERRSQAGLELLSSTSKEVTIKYPKDYLFVNSTPIGRILNRTVVVRIYK